VMEIVQTTQPTYFRLSEDFLAPYQRKGDPFTSLLARSTYLTKYCRGNVETWTETIRRVVEGNVNLAYGVSRQEAELLFHLFWTGQVLPPGRGLWTGGVEGIPADARFNCFAAETQFWANGILTTFREAAGQTVEVLAKDGQWRSAKVRSFGQQRLFTYLLKPPGRTNFAFKFTATAEHRWFTSNRGEVTDLKVGDKVIELGGGGLGSYDAVSTVDRLTKTQIITKSDHKYRLSDGSGFSGAHWQRGLIVEPTQERIATIRQANLARTFGHYDWKKLPLETLVAIWKLLPKKESE